MAQMSTIIMGFIILIGKINCLLKNNNEMKFLEISIVTEYDEIIELKWKPVTSFLVNKNLPIWTTTSDYWLHRHREIMRDIGDLTMYYDLMNSSAAVFLHKQKCIHAIVDVRFRISCIPLDQLHNKKHKVGNSTYVKRQKFHTPVNHAIPMDFFETHDIPQHHMMSIPILRNKKNFYPEILILIPNEIASITPSLHDLVLDSIVQFNAVAMLFAKLLPYGLKININIGGVIIEKNREIFPSSKLFKKDNLPHGDLILNETTRYIKLLMDRDHAHQVIFNDDSIDMFILLTSKEWQEYEIFPGGYATQVFDIKIDRTAYKHSLKKKMLGSIVDTSKMLHLYVNIVDQISYLMQPFDMHLINNSNCLDNLNYRSIILKSGNFGNSHLTWSLSSIRRLIIYFSSNRNRCFLLNFPRSLYPYNQPIKSLTPREQCLCYGDLPGKKTTYLNSDRLHRISDCGQKLSCIARETIHKKVIDIPIPMDGTPCDQYNSKKVCWRERCISKFVHRPYYNFFQNN